MPKRLAAGNRSRGALIVLLLAFPLAAQDAASVALGDAEPLPALRSADALTRAAAARVVLVRGVAAAVPELRAALTDEKDANAAREQMRALVLLGSDDDVAFAASQLQRFPSSIEGDFAEAIGRIGAPRATTLYLKHVADTCSEPLATKLALWGRAGEAAVVASRLLGAEDSCAFGSLLADAADARVTIDPGVLAAALSASNETVSDTIWYLVQAYAADPSKFPASLREAATAPREGEAAEESFGRELLRRMLGAKPVEQPGALEWLKERVGWAEEVNRLLTERERAALSSGLPVQARGFVPAADAQPVQPPAFRLSIQLPPGLAAAILKKTRCTDLWIGVAEATVDRAGRVQTLDAKGIASTARCQRALETMVRLSLAEPDRITSPLESSIVLVKPPGAAVCFDEDPVSDLVAAHGTLRPGGPVKVPRVVKRVEPLFPKSARRQMGGVSTTVVAEAVITRSGCMRDLRLVGQSPWPQLNSAALIALSQWRFEPGTLDGVPVDVLFHQTVSFKP